MDITASRSDLPSIAGANCLLFGTVRYPPETAATAAGSWLGVSPSLEAPREKRAKLDVRLRSSPLGVEKGIPNCI